MSNFTPGLFWTALENMARQAVLQSRDLLTFGMYPWYWKMKSAFWGLEPPYSIIERNAPDIPVTADELIYGEAPLFTLEKIMKKVGLTSDDHFFDLGSGRGIPVVFGNLRFGCTSTGIEIVPELTDQAEILAGKTGVSRVNFLRGDFRQLSLDGGTVFMVCGTTFHTDTLDDLGQRLKNLPGVIRAVSLSYPLPHLNVLDKEVLPFSWGQGTVFYQDNKG